MLRRHKQMAIHSRSADLFMIFSRQCLSLINVDFRLIVSIARNAQELLSFSMKIFFWSLSSASKPGFSSFILFCFLCWFWILELMVSKLTLKASVWKTFMLIYGDTYMWKQSTHTHTHEGTITGQSMDFLKIPMFAPWAWRGKRDMDRAYSRMSTS